MAPTGMLKPLRPGCSVKAAGMRKPWQTGCIATMSVLHTLQIVYIAVMAPIGMLKPLRPGCSMTAAGILKPWPVGCRVVMLAAGMLKSDVADWLHSDDGTG